MRLAWMKLDRLSIDEMAIPSLRGINCVLLEFVESLTSMRESNATTIAAIRSERAVLRIAGMPTTNSRDTSTMIQCQSRLEGDCLDDLQSRGSMAHTEARE